MVCYTKSKRITYLDERRQQREVYVSAGYSEEQINNCKKSVKLLAALKRRDINEILFSDRKLIDDLPSVFRQRLIAKGLLEGKTNERIPTLAELMEHWQKSRPNRKPLTLRAENQFFCNLLGYIPGNTLLTDITREQADNFKYYLTVMRNEKNGVLSMSVANRTLNQIKGLFNFAVKRKYLTESPFADVKSGATSSGKNRY